MTIRQFVNGMFLCPARRSNAVTSGITRAEARSFVEGELKRVEEGLKVDLDKESERIQREITSRLAEGNVRLAAGKYLTPSDLKRMLESNRANAKLGGTAKL